MTDSRHHFPRLEKILHQSDHGWIAAHLIRCISTWYDDAVVIGCGNLVSTDVDIHLKSRLSLIGFGGSRTHHRDICPGFFKPVIGVPKFEFVVHLLGKNDYSFSLQFHHRSSSLLMDTFFHY